MGETGDGSEKEGKQQREDGSERDDGGERGVKGTTE